jgi:hypothetical protein
LPPFCVAATREIEKAGAKGLFQGGRTGMVDAEPSGWLGAYAKGTGDAYWLAQTYALLGLRAQAPSYLATSSRAERPKAPRRKSIPRWTR